MLTPCQTRILVVLGGNPAAFGSKTADSRQNIYTITADYCDIGRNRSPADKTPMPSLFRFLFVVGIICAVGYSAVFALAHFVTPKPREISVTLPQDKFYKQR